MLDKELYLELLRYYLAYLEIPQLTENKIFTKQWSLFLENKKT